MIGDLYFINGKPQETVSEEVITVYPQETDKQQAARRKTGKPMPSFQYTAVKTRPVRLV